MRLTLNEDMLYGQKLVRLHLRPIVLAQEGVTDSAVRRLVHDAGADVHDLMALCRADITSKNSNKVARFLHNLDLVDVKIAKLQEADALHALQPVVTGSDIMEYLQIPPGPRVGKIKTLLKEAVVSGELPNERPALYAYLRQILARPDINGFINIPQ